MTLPFSTPDLPGTGGRVRTRPEDFVVEEIPAYEPGGTGEHLYLRIEKRGVSTHAAVRRIARALDVAPRDVGFAGLKDAQSVARQTLSVAGVDAAVAGERLRDLEGVTLLSAVRHTNKLRLGHLRGNRFHVVLRGVCDGAEARARAVLDVLAQRGAPNWFGPQRFGVHGGNDVVGRRILQTRFADAVRALLEFADDDARDEVLTAFDEQRFDDAADALPGRRRDEREVLRRMAAGKPPAFALRALPRHVLRLLVSAYQSAMFNRLAALRADDLGRLERGDLAFLHDRGAVFSVEDAAAEQARADALEISPSAPLFGTKSTLAGGAPGERERALLAEEGLTLADFRTRATGELRGERRPLRVPLADPEVRTLEHGDSGEPALEIEFALPRGSFATAVLREVTKDPDLR